MKGGGAGYTTTPGRMPIELRDRIANRPPMVTYDQLVGMAGVQAPGSGVARSRMPDNARWRLGAGSYQKEEACLAPIRDCGRRTEPNHEYYRFRM